MYEHGRIDKKWQDRWAAAGAFRAEDFSDKPKKYFLVEFPYPSGAGLHVGHPRSYVAIDVLARRARMMGDNVLYPMGWDAFGLPTENFALKTGRPPAEITAENVAVFKRQIQSLGLSFDWSREINSTDAAYYKWTQWQFLQFFKAGLAYKAKTWINWCPKDKIGLANEEAAGGVCDRCGGPVEKREKEQWMIGITKYADRLLADLDTVNYLPKIRKQQEEWIGKSEGAEVIFKLVGVPGQPDGAHSVTVFTTRPDTLFGATYIAISAELAQKWFAVGWQASDEVKNFVAEVLEDERARETTREDVVEKKGIATGIFAINPVNGEKIPVWIANYVLGGVGTGAIMAVPAHDERDWEFAKKFWLEIKKVVLPPKLGGIPMGNVATKAATEIRVEAECWINDGVNINSEFLNGLTTHEAKEKMILWLEEHTCGVRKTTYKLRDWVFSRQRYWGEPIPLVYCDVCATKKQKVLLIHGYGGSADKNWFPWMKQELESRGFEVFCPELSNSRHPDFEKWMEELSPYVAQLSEDDIIVGHSLGSKAALSAIERSGMKIGHVFLVASALGSIHERDWQKYKADAPSTRDVDALQKFWNAPLDMVAVDKRVGSVQLVWSTDDPLVPSVRHNVLPAGWFVNTKTGFEHFTDEVIPELLEIILTAKISGWNPLPDSALPLTLPAVEKYEPTDTGESPLASIPEFVNTQCPRCGAPAKRETDTMPNWAGSSWYFLRYLDAHNDTEFAAADKLKYWMPVDLYNGGMEHTVLHLLYSRFWNKFMYDCGYVPTPEPYARRVSHGLIMAEDGQKMSKSKGNVVNPDEIVQAQGADTLRVYEMFIGPFSEPAPWSENGVTGVKRFLDRVMRLPTLIKSEESEDVTRGLNKMLKKVSEDFDRMSFNTAIAECMTFVNTVYAAGAITEASLKKFIIMVNVFAPHVGEEVWELMGGTELVCQQPWPAYDASLLHAATYELVVQVNGKVRDRITTPMDASEDDVRAAALQSEKVQEWLAGKTPTKITFVKNKLISIAV